MRCDAVLTNNSSLAMGGGLAVNADAVTIQRVTLSANMGRRGAGAYFGGTSATALTTLTNVTISGNTAHDGGGGLWIDQTPTALKHVTIAGTTFTVAGGGGAGVLGLDGAPVDFRASIIAGNTGGNCEAAAGSVFTSSGFNIDSGTTCGFTAGSGGDQTSTNPSLGSLQDNGGPTPTRAIGPGSAALDR